MQELSNTYSFADIHFPQRTSLIKKLRYVSFAINDSILILSLFVFLVWVFHVPSIGSLLFHKLGISPFTSVLFILSGSSLFFGAKRHLMDTHKDAEKDDSSWWNTWIPIFLAVITAVFGLVNVVRITEAGALSLFRTSFFGGFCFFIIGLSLVPPFTRIIHRFHITQLLMFAVSGLNVLIALEYVYQLFSPLPMQQLFSVSLPTALTFVFFGFGVLLRWSNRGFFGNYTLDSVGSMLALRLFMFHLASAPLLAFVALLVMHNSIYNMYQILSVIVVGFASLSIFLLWINVKLLYKYELEHLLMRESLRAHNIDLLSEKEELQKNMVRLEQEKQQYLDKLDTQDKLRTITETLG